MTVQHPLSSDRAYRKAVSGCGSCAAETVYLLRPSVVAKREPVTQHPIMQSSQLAAKLAKRERSPRLLQANRDIVCEQSTVVALPVSPLPFPNPPQADVQCVEDCAI